MSCSLNGSKTTHKTLTDLDLDPNPDISQLQRLATNKLLIFGMKTTFPNFNMNM